MPGIWTHISFCESVVDTLQIPSTFTKLESIMKLGAQGFDPLLYYNFQPLIQNPSVRFSDTLLYSQRCSEFLKDLIKSAKDQRREVKSYVFGFITNYILKCYLRPFINYFAGNEGMDRRKLAIHVDTLLMEQYHNLQTWKTPVYKEIDVGFSLDKDIVELIHLNSIKHFPHAGFNSSKFIQKSYRHMKLALRMLYDPHGWKQGLFGTFLSPFSYQPVDENKDYLNSEKKTWVHPTEHKSRTDSFMELYDQAKIETVEVMTEVLSYWNESSVKAETNMQILLESLLSLDINNQVGYQLFKTEQEHPSR